MGERDSWPLQPWTLLFWGSSLGALLMRMMMMAMMMMIMVAVTSKHAFNWASVDMANQLKWKAYPVRSFVRAASPPIDVIWCPSVVAVNPSIVTHGDDVGNEDLIAVGWLVRGQREWAWKTTQSQIYVCGFVCLHMHSLLCRPLLRFDTRWWRSRARIRSCCCISLNNKIMYSGFSTPPPSSSVNRPVGLCPVHSSVSTSHTRRCRSIKAVTALIAPHPILYGQRKSDFFSHDLVIGNCGLGELNSSDPYGGSHYQCHWLHVRERKGGLQQPQD